MVDLHPAQVLAGGRAALAPHAVRSADDYTAALLEQALDTTADRTGALVRFAGRLDPDEAAALRAALTLVERDPDPREGG
ncbi:hypothetical protein [Streptomyces sp. PT12]|uniref:hypothetical protein n=1 Tax=Streptomyces sp. PT12 TaxID=1510197 RepID=UPI00215C82A2|nr:hypothetical protein [Streptomyces sp. PT12]